MKVIGIYKITNPLGRVYVGQSVNVLSRMSKYKNNNCKTQVLLYRSLMKYGWDNHTFEVIEECEVDKLNERERYWQEYYDVLNTDKGLNCFFTKAGNKSGSMRFETKNKIGIKNKGKKLTKEHIEIIRKRMIGRKLTESHRINISKSIKGKKFKLSDSVRRNRSESAIKRFSKRIIDNNDGKIYFSSKEYSEVKNVDYNKVRNMVNGKIKNVYNISKYEG